MTAPRTLLMAWNLRARKELGQNFLINQQICRRIAEQAGIDGDETVLEIGAGLGALTVAAAARAGHVVAVEKDRRLVELLRTELLTAGITNVSVMQGDILRLDLEPLYQAAQRPLVVMGNLPYNISSQVLVKLMAHRPWVARAVLMFQKELAQRLSAPPGTKIYGRLSVLLQYCARIDALMDIDAAAFFPRPKVDSSVVAIRFYNPPTIPVRDETVLNMVVKAAFGQRRKTLKNALRGGQLGLDADTAARLLKAAAIDPARRAETLTVAEFAALSDQIVLMKTNGV